MGFRDFFPECLGRDFCRSLIPQLTPMLIPFQRLVDCVNISGSGDPLCLVNKLGIAPKHKVFHPSHTSWRSAENGFPP